MLHYLYLVISFIADLAVSKVRGIADEPFSLLRFLLLFAMIYAVCLTVHIALMSLLSIFFDRDSRVTSMNSIFRKASMASLSLVIRFFRVKVTVIGEEKIPKDGRFLMVGNHRAFFDPIVAMFYFRKHHLGFVSKKENVAVPFLGRLMLACACLPLDRENVRAAATTINDAAELIRSGIASVGIYPEGKVNQTDEILLPFRNGAFKIAKKAKCPIVVITASNTGRVLKRWPLRHTEVELEVLAVLSAEEVATMTTAQLSEAVYPMMYENLAAKEKQEALVESDPMLQSEPEK